jgi:uncharacterized membrane protein YraQ (UPF0718 family)
MFWEVFWPLILGFSLSGIVQALVSKGSIAKLLGKDNAKCYSLASLFGAASSSCSYAAVALARSLFRKGATFTSSMIFEIASTNLVIEMGLVLLVLLGWQFLAAEVVGGILMIVIISLIFKLTLRDRLVSLAKNQAEKGLTGRMEGHAEMDMSLTGGSFISRLFSSRGFTSVSHYFVADWLSVWVDIALGFLIAGVLATFVPTSFWRAFFFSANPTLAAIEGPLVGPLVAMVSFVCSIGNIPLAAVLWREGISFGGVVSFIFADLLVLPILDIYRRYYGKKVMLYILGTFYVAMALAGYAIEFLFAMFKITPTNRNIAILLNNITWNYTTILNIIFILIAVVLLIRFLKTNGLGMLKMMGQSPQENHAHHHHH